MKRNTKIIICAIIIVVFLLGIVSISLNIKFNIQKADDGKLNIVTTTFAAYDFSKQIIGDNGNATFLLGPGVDAHSYDPSSGDLIKIKNADIFIYIGGEMEQWVDKIFETDVIDKNKTKLLKISDCIEMIEEKEVDGAEEEHEHEEIGAYDEHIWSSPENSIEIIKYLNKEFSQIDEENKEIYSSNSEKYIQEIKEVQSEIKNIVENKKRNRLVFGDKMPMQYFIEEFGLDVSAAFNGCSTEGEPSAKTMMHLINRIKEENIPVVLYIELSSGKTAKSIARETKTKALQIQTLHNISKSDFYNGETYVSLMKRNIDVLKEALQ